MQILSWNIQSGLGCDGVRSISRIIARIRFHGESEIICLQEVARHFPEHCNPGEEDQLQIICTAFPEYKPVWGTGMRWMTEGAGPMEFGNLTLVKTNLLLDCRVHSLPRPPGAGKKQMPRNGVESVINTSIGPITLINTHIAYHNEKEQRLQLSYLRQFQDWQEENSENQVGPGRGAYADLHRTADTIICGDLNITPDSSLYSGMVRSGWYDSYEIVHPDMERVPTCGVHDRDLWKEGPHCRDYFLVTASLRSFVSDMRVDTECNYSDHQPILLNLSF